MNNKIVAGPGLRAEAIRATKELLTSVKVKKRNLGAEAGLTPSTLTRHEWEADTEARLAALQNLDEFMQAAGH